MQGQGKAFSSLPQNELGLSLEEWVFLAQQQYSQHNAFIWIDKTETPSTRSDFYSYSLIEVFQALEQKRTVIVEIPWHQSLATAYCENNQIQLDSIQDGRIYFHNPLSALQLAQSIGQSQPHGPERQCHANGLESMDLKLFEQLFCMNGGRASLR